MSDSRFDRQLQLFGKSGQAKLRSTRAVVVGAGGTGSIVIPQLALLGVGEISVIDPDEADETTRNRHLCVRESDSIPGTWKVDAAARAIREYDSTISIQTIRRSLISTEGFDAVRSADIVFGCVDLDGIRLVLTELCSAYNKTYIDIASGIDLEPPLSYGGRVCCSVNGEGCLICSGELDVIEAARDLENPNQRSDREAVYGVDRQLLHHSGPSVVSINAVVGSLAITEFVKLCTGPAKPSHLLRYDAKKSTVFVRRPNELTDCYYCRGIRGIGSAAEVERYLWSKLRSQELRNLSKLRKRLQAKIRFHVLEINLRRNSHYSMKISRFQCVIFH